MNIVYNGVDITRSVQPLALRLTDRAGGRPDDLTVIFSDTEGQWGKWKPQKNDTIQLKESGFDSGILFVDQLEQKPGTFELKSLSIPMVSKTAHTQAWENIRLLEIASQLAARYGFNLQTYNIVNHLYERLDQYEETDFSFFAEHVMLEGYSLKIHNKSLLIYDEAAEEKKDAVIIRRSDMSGNFKFVDKSNDIFSKCIIRSSMPSGYLEGQFVDKNISGPTLKRKIYTANQAEANRWAKGILRSYNKYRAVGTFSVDLNTGLAAGITVEINDIGIFDGKYFIDKLVHDFVNHRTDVTVRNVLEGY